MNTQTFNKGDTVYSIHGQEASYIARCSGGHVVEPVFQEDESDEPHYGEPQTWREVFRKPPTEKLQHEVAALEAKLTLRRNELDELREQRDQIEREAKARLERIKRHEQLAELDLYLAGEITHYVAIHDYYPDVEIIPVGETFENYSNGNGYGLLTLCPSRHWDKKIYWTVTYKVPSPSYSRTKTVIPCCGEEAARAKAAEVLRGYLEEYHAMEPAKRSYAEMLEKCCRKFGVDVPSWLVDGIAAQARAQLERSITEHRQKLAEVEAKLAAFQPTTEVAA